MRELPSPLQRVYAYGDAYMRFAIERPAFLRFMMIRGLQPSDDAALSEVNERVSKRVQEMVIETAVALREAMQAGEVPVAPVDEMIVMLFGLWNGVIGLVVRADGTEIPADLALRALERSRVLLHRAAEHEFAQPEAPPVPWERGDAARVADAPEN